MEISEIKNNFVLSLKNINVSFTGLSSEEKDIINTLSGLGIKTTNIDDADLLVCGSDAAGTKKVSVAHSSKIKVINLEQFKNLYMFNHNFKDFLKDKVVAIDSDFPDFASVALLNPKKIYFENNINKKKAQEIDFIFTFRDIDDFKPGLSSWLEKNDKIKVINSISIEEIKENKAPKKKFR